jgi:phage FluMu protein gp41
MKVFPATQRDNEREVMRCELTAGDVETLELLAERVEILLKIEEVLGVVAIQSPFILGTDVPTVTAEGLELLRRLVAGWGSPDGAVLVEEWVEV